jgi:hypothetical protein
MKPKLIPLLVACVVAISGCSKAPEKPKLSDIFKSQLVQYLKDAGKISTQSTDGISFKALGSNLAEAKATFDLLEQTWPKGLWADAKECFEKSHQGYALALKLLNDKIQREDEPRELLDNLRPDRTGWIALNAYAGSSLVVKTYDEKDLTARTLTSQFLGTKYLPFDPNISVLLTIASAEFKKGRGIVIKELN